MRLFPTAEFTTTLPDDDVWDGDDLVQVAGLNVVQAIAADLEKQGFSTSAPTADVGHFSWTFFAVRNGSKFWLQVGRADECHLVALDVSSVWSRLTSQKAYPDFLSTLHGCLSNNSAFRQLLWYPSVRQPGHVGVREPVA